MGRRQTQVVSQISDCLPAPHLGSSGGGTCSSAFSYGIGMSVTLYVFGPGFRETLTRISSTL